MSDKVIDAEIQAPVLAGFNIPALKPENLVQDMPAAYEESLKPDWIPAIQLLQKQSKAIENAPAGLEPMPAAGMFWIGSKPGKLVGHYEVDKSGRVTEGFFPGVAVSARIHANVVSGGQCVMETFDYDDVYKKIEAMPKTQGGPVARVGGDVLFYLPETGEFGEYFLYSTGLDAFNVIKNQIKKDGPTLFKMTWFPDSNSKGSWCKPHVVRWDGPTGHFIDVNQEVLLKKLEQFQNEKPRKSEAEKMAETAAAVAGGKDR